MPTCRIALVVVAASTVAASVLFESPALGSDPRLKVVAHAIQPCVRVDNGRFSGFEIDLLRGAARRAGVQLDFTEVPRLPTIFAQLERGEADLAVAGITITEAREKRIDFSHPTLAAGYSILVRQRAASSFLGDLRAFITQPHLATLLGVFVLFLVICAHVAWLAERGTEVISDRYYPGVFEALWFVWVTSTTVGYGDIAPKRWVGRLAASLIMLVGIGFAGILISELSSFRVTDRLESQIRSDRDLAGKRVATKAGTSSVAVLESLQAKAVALPTIDAAFDALASGRVRAVVFDSPVIAHYAKSQGAKRGLAVAGPTFRRQSYGFAFPQGSPWRERINSALLAMIEDGSYEQLYQRYFGQES